MKIQKQKLQLVDYYRGLLNMILMFGVFYIMWNIAGHDDFTTTSLIIGVPLTGLAAIPLGIILKRLQDFFKSEDFNFADAVTCGAGGLLGCIASLCNADALVSLSIVFITFYFFAIINSIISNNKTTKST